MNFTDALKEAGNGEHMEISEEYLQPTGVTYETATENDGELNALMDLVAYINNQLEEMDWESLPLQGRIKKEDLVISLRLRSTAPAGESKYQEALDFLTDIPDVFDEQTEKEYRNALDAMSELINISRLRKALS